MRALRATERRLWLRGRCTKCFPLPLVSLRGIVCDSSNTAHKPQLRWEVLEYTLQPGSLIPNTRYCPRKGTKGREIIHRCPSIECTLHLCRGRLNPFLRSPYEILSCFAPVSCSSLLLPHKLQLCTALRICRLLVMQIVLFHNAYCILHIAYYA